MLTRTQAQAQAQAETDALRRDTQAALDGMTAALARADVALAHLLDCERRIRELRTAERVADILAARYHLPPVRPLRPINTGR